MVHSSSGDHFDDNEVEDHMAHTHLLILEVDNFVINFKDYDVKDVLMEKVFLVPEN